MIVGYPIGMRANAAMAPQVEPLSAAHDDFGNCRHAGYDCLGFPIPELVSLGGGFAPLPASHGRCRSLGKHGHSCLAARNQRPVRAKAGRYAGEWVATCCCGECHVKAAAQPELF